jgi:hypothetical protein
MPTPARRCASASTGSSSAKSSLEFLIQQEGAEHHLVGVRDLAEQRELRNALLVGALQPMIAPARRLYSWDESSRSANDSRQENG